jgi:hypothetical protein
MPLTELQIKALTPEAIRYAVSDGRGLALEVLPTCAASWRYRYQFKGKTEKVSLGKYPFVSLKAARSKRERTRKGGARWHIAGEAKTTRKVRFSELYLRRRLQ